jgi:hypothetical protein
MEPVTRRRFWKFVAEWERDGMGAPDEASLKVGHAERLV